MFKFSCLFVFIFFVGLYAQKIQDIPTYDTAYPAIKNSLQLGYLTLFNDKTFRGNLKISRRELALTVDKLLSSIDQKSFHFKSAEREDFIHFVKNYTPIFSKINTQISQIQEQLPLLKDNQDSIHYDLSATSERFEAKIRALEKKSKWQTAALSGVSLLAVISLMVQ